MICFRWLDENNDLVERYFTYADGEYTFDELVAAQPREPRSFPFEDARENERLTEAREKYYSKCETDETPESDPDTVINFNFAGLIPSQ